MEIMSLVCELLLGMSFIGLLWQWNELWFVTSVKARCSSLNLKMFPGHLRFPLFGEMLTFLCYFKILRRPDDFIYSKIRTYGENVGGYRTYLFGAPSILVCSPSLSKFVLNSPEKFKQALPTTEAQGPNSVIALEGPHHDRVKSLLQNAINHPNALARIACHVQPLIVETIKSWAQKGQITTVDELKKVTLLNMGRYFASLDFEPHLQTLEKMMHAITQGFRAQPSKIPGSAYHYAVKCRNKFRNMLRVELEKRKEELKNNKISVSEAKDLMDELMQMRDEEGKTLTDEEVLDNVLSSIHVGNISTAYLSTWALYFVAKDTNVLRKLREENMSLAKEKKDSFITYQDIVKLKYTNKVVEETVRLANLSGFVFRKASKDIDYKGYMIPKDWAVIVWIRHLHADPANFDNPTCFNPDRWDVGTFYAYGGGWKSCPGNMLVRLQLVILLHHLAVGYKWELVNQDVKINYLSHPIPNDGLKLLVSKL